MRKACINSKLSRENAKRVVDEINSEMPEARLAIVADYDCTRIITESFTAEDADLLKGILVDECGSLCTYIEDETMKQFNIAFVNAESTMHGWFLKTAKEISLDDLIYKIKPDGTGAYFYNTKKIVSEANITNEKNLKRNLIKTVKTLMMMKNSLLPTITAFNDNLNSYAHKAKAISMRMMIEME